MKTIKDLYLYFTGQSQGMFLPDWMYKFFPLWDNKTQSFKWLFWYIKPKNSRGGDTLFMALKRK